MVTFAKLIYPIKYECLEEFNYKITPQKDTIAFSLPTETGKLEIINLVLLAILHFRQIHHQFYSLWFAIFTK